MLKEVKLKNGSTVVKGTTPKGRVEFAHVYEPQRQIGDQAIEPTYSINLIMDGNDEVKRFIDCLDAEMNKAEEMAQEAANQAKGRSKGKLPTKHDENYGEVYDDDGNPTGQYFVKAKAKAEGITQAGKKWKFKPTIFDAKGVPFPEKNPPMIGNGSTGRLALTAYAYAAPIGYGISIRLEAVQIIDLVEYNGKSATDYGFSVEEGYSVDEVAPLTLDGENEAPDELEPGEQPKSYRSRMTEDEGDGDF